MLASFRPPHCLLYPVSERKHSRKMTPEPWGKKYSVGPGYANCFVDFIEHQLFSQYNGPKPELYDRYIDDCISATFSTRDELTQLITVINSFRLALKYT